MKIIFEEVSLRASKYLPCPICGKKLRRQTTFTQTLNPFNRSLVTGLPRTREEIYAELQREKAYWEKDPAFCDPCRESLRVP